jgi:hypothetical protein
MTPAMVQALRLAMVPTMAPALRLTLVVPTAAQSGHPPAMVTVVKRIEHHVKKFAKTHHYTLRFRRYGQLCFHTP